MPEVQSLKKRKDIEKSTQLKQNLEESPGSLYMKFEEEYPSLGKFVENDHSLLLKSNPGFKETIMNDENRKEDKEVHNKGEIEPASKKEKNDEKLSNYSNIIGDEAHYERVIDSESFKKNVEDKSCYTCRNNQCFIQ